MQKNELLRKSSNIIRILEVADNDVLSISCNSVSVPKWCPIEALSEFEPCNNLALFQSTGFTPVPINELSAKCRKTAYERFNLVTHVIPFIGDKKQRTAAILKVSEDNSISRQTVSSYLWKYLVYQDVSALAPVVRKTERELTSDEKNFRRALNKYYYKPSKYSLYTTYLFMLRDRYCDSDGVLLPEHPSFNRFRYFYRKTYKVQNDIISRKGIKYYQRNCRPLVGNGVQAFAPCIGTGMLDSTICDIHLVDESGNLIGRPILTACVDACSGMCCGYTLSLEGGMYSLRNLMLNVIADKVAWCKSFGITIEPEDWNCSMLPAHLVTDMGKEYVSENFDQITDLGVKLTSLPAYRPELKGVVEKFFDLIQQSYKPYLYRKGVIENDCQERGAHDYRKDACLTLFEFEQVILRCIIYHNTQRIFESFPYSDDMLARDIPPHANAIWNNDISDGIYNLIPVSAKELTMVLLPRTKGRFSRHGLSANKLHYYNADYKEHCLLKDSGIVAYNPDDVSVVWLIENGEYVPFELIEIQFSGKTLDDVSRHIAMKKEAIEAAQSDNLQARLDLIAHIETISSVASKPGETKIKGVRKNRTRERARIRKGGNTDNE